jgi:hypothetical protein
VDAAPYPSCDEHERREVVEKDLPAFVDEYLPKALFGIAHWYVLVCTGLLWLLGWEKESQRFSNVDGI